MPIIDLFLFGIPFLTKKFFSGYARIILAVISFYFMQSHYIIAGWCYIVSALLDAIDGHAARAFNQSEFNRTVNQITAKWIIMAFVLV